MPAATDNPFADLLPQQGNDSELETPNDYGQFSDLVDLGNPAPDTSAALAQTKQLIGGGTADAPAFQIVGQKFSDVPRAVAVSTTDYGPFSDLAGSAVPAPIDNYTQEFGMFADLAPRSPAPQTEKATAEADFYARQLEDANRGTVDAFKKLFADFGDKPLVQIPADAVKRTLSLTRLAFPNIGAALTAIGATLPEGAKEGLAQSSAATLTSLTSPQNIAMLAAVGSAPAVIQKAVSLGFSGYAAHQMGQEIGNAVNEKDPVKFFEHVGNAVTQGAFMTLAGLHGLTPAEAPVRPATPEETAPATTERPPTQAGEGAPAAPAREPVGLEQRLPMPQEPVPTASEAAPISQPAREGGEPTAAVSPDVGAAVPTLRQGENQGDLLSTQSEDLTLVGEKGVDHGARQTAAEKAAQDAEEARLKAESEQEALDLFREQTSGDDELLTAITKEGGLPARGSPHRKVFSGELSRIDEAVRNPMRVEKISPNKIFRNDAPPLDVMVKSLQGRGFDVERPSDLVNLLEERIATGTPHHPNIEFVPGEQNDWTGATLGAVAPGTAQLQQVGAAVSGAAKGIGKNVTSLKPFTDYRRARLNWSARNQASTGEIHKASTDIQKLVPNRARREGITNWIQAKGDVAELATRAQATKNLQLRRGYEAAQQLTPQEKALAGKISQTYEILRQRAEANGIEIARLEDYVNQIWKRAPAKEFMASSSRRLSTNVRFAKQRFHESFFHGEQAGLRPETKDIAKLLPIYMNEINNAISAKQFVAEMAGGKAADGRPLLVPRGGGTVIEPSEGKKGAVLTFPDRMTEETTDYKTLGNQPALHDWKWVAEENGKPILLKGDLAVHPDAYHHLKNVLGQSAIREWYRSPSETALGAIPKAATKFLLDDVQQVGKATMLGFLSPFHQVQEGTHAIGHRVNPFGGLEKIDLKQPRQMDAAQHGLMLLPDRVSANQFKEGLDGSTRNLLSNLLGKVGGKPGRLVKEWADGYQHYLFHQYIPALKFKTYEHILGRNNARYAKELKAGTVSPEQVKFLSAEQANAAYGHLNYADMGRNPTLQHLAQTFLLAPDFLEARTRFAGQAAGGAFGRAGREQMAAIATLAATQWILARVLNKTLDDNYHWDEPFGVIVGNRRYTMRSVPEDIYKAFTETRRFAYGRLSPLVGRGLIEGLSGVNYRSEPTTIADTLTNILAGMIPLSVQPLTRGLTETTRDNPVSPFEQLLGSLGLHVSRFSPISKVYSLSKDWIEQHGKQYGVLPQKGVYPVSKYQQLRYALEDGDFEKAKVERQKLIDAGEKPNKIGTGFRQSINHPFTGSLINDNRFKKSLSREDRALYDAAVKRRRLILERYGKIPK